MCPKNTITELRSMHPNFSGNWEDLAAFDLLMTSPIRSPERQTALQKWADYKMNRQREALLAENTSKPILGMPLAFTKGGHLIAARKQVVDLSGATLDDAILGYADMRAVILRHASMRGVWMKGCQFQDADLSSVDCRESEAGRDARLMDSSFDYALMKQANFQGVDLSGSSFRSTQLQSIRLNYCNLSNCTFLESDLSNGSIAHSRIYGISAWDVQKENTEQQELLIEKGGSSVSVDDLEMAQFVYLLLNNKKISSAISTLGKKAVLILGRFTPERKVILDAIREKIRTDYDLLPIVFDFERAVEKDFTETVKVLAGLSRYVIADITNPKSSPLELQATIPNCMIPFVVIIEKGQYPFSMFTDLWKKYDKWVLEPISYLSKESLLDNFDKGIIRRARKKEKELMEYKLIDRLEVKDIGDI